jgi:hypothetical protein
MLTERTLPMLTTGGVDPARVTVFTHDHDPNLPAYRTITRSSGVALQVTTARGINAQRTEIINHYPPGTPLTQVDDDLTGVVAAVDKKTLRRVTDIHGLIEEMFWATAARDLHVWGLAPVPNAFYLTPGHLSEGLKFLIYTMIGVYTRPGHPVHTTTVATKDDYELSLRAWWYDGASLRHDGAAAKADIYKAPGGCQATRKPEHAQQAVTELLRAWPGLVRRNTRRKSDYPEILLTPRKRHTGHPPTTPPPGVHQPQTTAV